MSESDVYRIKPSGKHLDTIGRDLIQDGYAAILELVKNSWDADSSDVSITFKENTDQNGYVVSIEDHGHGMTRDVVINQWMVPSTDDKKTRKESPGNRTMQGRKGIGRYAAAILGDDLFLETITAEGEYTTVLLKWSDFKKAEFLDDVDVLIETKKSDLPCGTRLTINNSSSFSDMWDNKQLEKLRFELKKLMSPIETFLEKSSGPNTKNFKISLNIKQINNQKTLFENENKEVIEPYPISQLYDYRISGKINEKGKGILTYYLQKSMKNVTKEEMILDIRGPTDCGELLFDIRVYDRDKESIEALIHKGLKDEHNNYVGKNQARELLNYNNGIGVYRNGFRIRPLGDPDFDWLELNKKRVQNPSLKIGSNQGIGYVQIQSEEQSNLIEKSARDGLKKNQAFFRMQQITNEVIALLERKRFNYRKNLGLNRSDLKIEKAFKNLLSFEVFWNEVQASLRRGNVNKKTSDEVIRLIQQDTETRNKIFANIRKSVAVYQGQATLGKIINVILHEGRNPLNFFKNQIPNLNYWANKLKEYYSDTTLEKIITCTKGIENNMDIFVNLFSRLDPLAAGRKDIKKYCSLVKEINKTIQVFESELNRSNIQVSIDGDKDFQYNLYKQDIYVIFTNLLDNSLFWMTNIPKDDMNITIKIELENHKLQYIDYLDTGPGIAKDLIEKELIFEPHFSTKPQGTGLGLAIAGEAAMRMGWEITVFESDSGVRFRIQEKGDSADEDV